MEEGLELILTCKMGKIWDNLVGKKKQEIVYPLDPETIKRDNYIKALTQAVQSRDAHITE